MAAILLSFRRQTGGLCSGPPKYVEIKGLPAAAARMAGLKGKELGKLYKKFVSIDVDNSKQICFGEFTDFIGEYLLSRYAPLSVLPVQFWTGLRLTSVALFCTDAIESEFIKEVCNRMVFHITDLDGDGNLSFEEFVLAAILLATFSKDQIMYIMFEIFDGNRYVTL